MEYRVICVHDQATVLRDGRELAVVRGLALNTGLIGLYAEKGTLELRNMRIQKAAEPPDVSGELRPSGPGISLPRPTRDVKPQYTTEALRLGIQGEVWIDCLVMIDGHVAQCRVVRRLSTDLDAQALEAARQWTFEPGTRDGMPTPVLITMAMTFALRK